MLALLPRVRALPRILLLLLSVSLGCSPGAGTHEPCLHSEEEIRRTAIGPGALSVVFVTHRLDDVAQAQLARHAPTFLDALRSGDLDADGTRDFPPPSIVRVAVTTADLGGPPELGCTFEGVSLVTNGGARFVTSTEPTFLDEVVTRLNAARSSCPVGQVLEAARRALEPDPHAPLPTFVAPAERLVLVLATTTDDCSGADLFGSSADPADREASADVACVRAERTPLSEYVETFATYDTFALALTGLPRDVDGLSRPLDGAALLARSELDERVVDGALAPSCARDGSSATPPRRLIEWSDLSETARVFPLHASICDDDLSDAFDALADRIARRELAACLAPLELARAADGLVPCRLHERDDDCAERPGRELTEDGCVVPQLAPGTEGAGWWYESREDAVEGSDLAWICAPFARLGGDFARGAVLRCPVSSCE
jgi:hypothetical protein